MSALAETPAPVPRILGVCEDETVVGTPFYVMELVEGRIFWDATLAELPPAERPAYFDAMNATLAAIHNVDPVAVGLADFGRRGNYFERQIRRWTTQYVEDESAGRDPNMDWLIEHLPRMIPPGEETAIVHGDFRIDNLIFHPSEPRIAVVLDWELSTLGHPLADLGAHVMMYHMPLQIMAGLGGADIATLNLPSRDAYVAAYCRRTGRRTLPHLDFYIAFNFFRMAAIFHGIKGRVVRGTAANAHAAQRAGSFPVLARIARSLAQQILELDR